MCDYTLKHTKFSNPKELQNADEVNAWLEWQNVLNIDGIKDKPIRFSMNNDGTIQEIEIGKKLTSAEKKIITDKFPELEGKEID